MNLEGDKQTRDELKFIKTHVDDSSICLLGGAVGDALFNPVEFKSLSQIRSNASTRNPQRESIYIFFYLGAEWGATLQKVGDEK